MFELFSQKINNFTQFSELHAELRRCELCGVFLRVNLGSVWFQFHMSRSSLWMNYTCCPQFSNLWLLFTRSHLLKCPVTVRVGQLPIEWCHSNNCESAFRCSQWSVLALKGQREISDSTLPFACSDISKAYDRLFRCFTCSRSILNAHMTTLFLSGPSPEGGNTPENPGLFFRKNTL